MSGEFISIFLASFVTFFVLIDALGVAPVFASLTVRGPASYRRSMAIRSVLVGTLIIFGFAFLEHHVERDDEQQDAAGGAEGINRDVQLVEQPGAEKRKAEYDQRPDQDRPDRH